MRRNADRPVDGDLGGVRLAWIRLTLCDDPVGGPLGGDSGRGGVNPGLSDGATIRIGQGPGQSGIGIARNGGGERMGLARRQGNDAGGNDDIDIL